MDARTARINAENQQEKSIKHWWNEYKETLFDLIAKRANSDRGYFDLTIYDEWIFDKGYREFALKELEKLEYKIDYFSGNYEDDPELTIKW